MSADAPDYGTPDTFSYPPGTALLNFQRNAGAVVAEPGLDLEDTGSVSWAIVDDPANSRVKVSASFSGVSTHGSTAVGGDGVDPGYVLTETVLTGLFASVAVNAGNVFVSSTVAGDTVDYRYTITAAGVHQWGSGSAARDANLYRGNIGQVKTDSLFYAVGGFVSQSPAGNFAYRNFLAAVDTQPSFAMLGSGSQRWGQGGTTATDTTLERIAAGTLRATNTGLLSTSPTVGLGYGTGAGAAVAQLTSRTTAVQINNVCGRITTNATSLATGATAAFVVNNSTVAATDAIVLNLTNAGAFTPLNFPYAIMAVAAGSFTVAYSNNTGSATVTAFVFNFAVVKAVNA